MPDMASFPHLTWQPLGNLWACLSNSLRARNLPLLLGSCLCEVEPKRRAQSESESTVENPQESVAHIAPTHVHRARAQWVTPHEPKVSDVHVPKAEHAQVPHTYSTLAPKHCLCSLGQGTLFPHIYTL